MRTEAERKLLREIATLAEWLGWRVRIRPEDVGELEGHPGFPDLLLLRPPRIVFAVVKGAERGIEVDEERWLKELRQLESSLSGLAPIRPNPSPFDTLRIEVYVWRTEDRTEIARLLTMDRA